MTTTISATRIDVREIAPRERHALIFSALRRLGTRETMEIVNDHDPRPLYDEMQAEQPGRFAWDCLESGPVVWRVCITKLASGRTEDQCCGGCGA